MELCLDLIKFNSQSDFNLIVVHTGIHVHVSKSLVNLKQFFPLAKSTWFELRCFYPDKGRLSSGSV